MNSANEEKLRNIAEIEVGKKWKSKHYEKMRKKMKRAQSFQEFFKPIQIEQNAERKLMKKKI